MQQANDVHGPQLSVLLALLEDDSLSVVSSAAGECARPDVVLLRRIEPHAVARQRWLVGSSTRSS